MERLLGTGEVLLKKMSGVLKKQAKPRARGTYPEAFHTARYSIEPLPF